MAASDSGPSSCIVCGASAWRPRYDILVECGECGYVRAAHWPTPEELAEVYDGNYFNGEEYGDYLSDTDVHLTNFARRLEWIERLGGRPATVFEVGSAYGLWLDFLTRQGIRGAGIDLSEEATQHAREVLGQDVAAGDFLDYDLVPGTYETFVMWDTIEHLLHPERYIARIAAALPPGGWLYLSTGDIGSRNARRRGRHWRMIHPPTHLHYFDRQSLGGLLARHGLETRHVDSLPIYRTLGGTLASLAALGRGPVKGLARALNALLPSRLTGALGWWIDLGDIIFVAAQKPGPQKLASTDGEEVPA